MKSHNSIAKSLVLMTVFITTSSAMAYEEDTHFQVTYVICRFAGMTDAEALKVAAVDQGMDDSPGTVANGGTGGIIPNVPEEWKWHALDRDGLMHASGVLHRKQLLYDKAITRPDASSKLFYLGVFFHYQGDTWAHRHHYDGHPHSYADFTTYNTPFGHAYDFHQPDRPPFDPVCALLNLEDGLRYAQAFVRDALHRPTRAFFNNYQAIANASIDKGWKDEGKYYHQLNAYGAANSPQKVMSDLIRNQINSYRSSIDPSFGFRYTADEADFERTRGWLNTTCHTYAGVIGERIVVPTKQQKLAQGYTHLTSAGIEAGWR